MIHEHKKFSCLEDRWFVSSIIVRPENVVFYLRFSRRSVYFMNTLIKTYETRTLLGLGVSRCWTRVVSDTDTYNYTELYNFFQIISCVGMSVSVSCPVSMLHRSKPNYNTVSHLQRWCRYIKVTTNSLNEQRFDNW